MDIVLLCETKLKGKNKLKLDGYEQFGQNRKSLKKTAKYVSGGIEIFVKNWVSHEHYQSVIEDDFEGIYGIRLQHKTSGRETIIIVCYLPAEDSERGQDDKTFVTIC